MPNAHVPTKPSWKYIVSSSACYFATACIHMPSLSLLIQFGTGDLMSYDNEQCDTAIILRNR